MLVGGDFTAAHVRQARQHYGDRVPVIQLDAHDLPFRAETFDIVILYEALYFLPAFERVVEACRHVLSSGGLLLIATANPQWTDFNPAPFSTRYFAANEVEDLLGSHGFSVQIFGGFPVGNKGPRDHFMSVAKRTAVKLHLIPRTMKGKEILKRLAFGSLVPFPQEVAPETATFHEPVRLYPPYKNVAFKVIYAVAQKEDT
jgi:SAM-dependent methyltransferase